MKFEEVGAKWGLATPAISQGTALADLDGDGDLDMVSNQLGKEVGVFRNDTSAPRIAVRLHGTNGNTAAIGARVTLKNGAVPSQFQEIMAGGRYLSSDEALRVFAVGAHPGTMQLEVRWPSGRLSTLINIQANQLYELHETGLPDRAASPAPTIPTPLFVDVSPMLAHVHHDDPFDDFARQPLLSRKLSQLGPGVGWVDLNNDGWDDVVIGSGRGGYVGAFLNQQGKQFIRETNAPFQRPVHRDQNSVLASGGAVILGSANWEDGSTNGGAVRIHDYRRKVSGELILGIESSTGPICSGDLDGDGDLDLFVGSRVVAGRYPEAAASKWFRNEGGRFVLAQRLETASLVSGAVLGDLDNDGDLDLVLAPEWGALQIWRNEGGKFVKADLGLGALTGWWNSIALADFDEDGKLDLVAGNWGLNHPYPATLEHPYTLYYGDLRGDGGVDLIDAYFLGERQSEVPFRSMTLVGPILPFIRENMNSFAAYGKASLGDVYGERLKGCGRLQAGTFASMVFLNRGTHFEPRLLPNEAQWSPCFGLAAGDLDGDGHIDLALSQNFSSYAGDGWRNDASRGLILLGDGHGQFHVEPHSGLTIYGDGRGLALADFDQDGRLDILAAQNGAATKLYRNQRARPGLRVILQGDSANGAGVGAQLRAHFHYGWGGLIQTCAGSGYGSQDSLVPIVGGTAAPQHLAVRWPGRGWVTNDVPIGTREIVLTRPSH